MSAADKVREQLARWDRKEIDKFEFYEATRHHRVSTVAEVTGIAPDVIRDRRRYLRQLAEDYDYGAVVIDGTIVARTSHKSI